MLTLSVKSLLANRPKLQRRYTWLGQSIACFWICGRDVSHIIRNYIRLTGERVFFRLGCIYAPKCSKNKNVPLSKNAKLFFFPKKIMMFSNLGGWNGLKCFAFQKMESGFSYFF